MTNPIWPRLQERWSALCPSLPRGGLNGPATPRQVDAVEALTGVRFPAELREAYLHFNGMQRALVGWSHDVRAPQLLINQFHWLDLESMANQWTQARCSEAGSKFALDT